MTNKLIQNTSELIKKKIEDFYSYDFSKEMAKKAVEEYGTTYYHLKHFTNESLGKLIKAGFEVSEIIPKFDINKEDVVLKSTKFFEIHRISLAILAFSFLLLIFW